MAYRQRNYFGGSRRYVSTPYASRRGMICMSKKQLAKKIRTVVSVSTGMIQKSCNPDPPPFKADRPWKRVIRYQVPEAATTVSVATLLATELGYYSGLTGNHRWASLKLLSVRAYGTPDIDAIAITIPTLSAIGTEIASTTYTDHSGVNHRACIQVILPPTAIANSAGSGSTLVSFAAGQLDIIDFYVELA